MKRAWIALGLLAVLASPSWATGIGAGFGYWDTSDAGDDTGFNFRLAVDMPKSNWMFELRATHLDNFSAVLSTVQGPRSFNLEATPIDIGASYVFSRGKLKPYAGGGFSYVFFDADVVGTSEAARGKDEPGWYGVVGVELHFHPRWAFYAEGLYRYDVEPRIQGDGLASFDEVIVDFSGGTVNAGIQFSW